MRCGGRGRSAVSHQGLQNYLTYLDFNERLPLGLFWDIKGITEPIRTGASVGLPGIVILVDIADSSERRSFRCGSLRCFYEGLPVAGHIGVILSSGTVIYLVQRHIVHQLTSLLLYFFKIGPIAQWELGYRESFGKQMWRRMGLRSPDKSTADAEDRFSNCLFSRWAGASTHYVAYG